VCRLHLCLPQLLLQLNHARLGLGKPRRCLRLACRSAAGLEHLDAARELLRQHGGRPQKLLKIAGLFVQLCYAACQCRRMSLGGAQLGAQLGLEAVVVVGWRL